MLSTPARYFVTRNVHGVCFVFDRHTNRLVWSGGRLSTAYAERDRLEALHTGG